MTGGCYFFDITRGLVNKLVENLVIRVELRQDVFFYRPDKTSGDQILQENFGIKIATDAITDE